MTLKMLSVFQFVKLATNFILPKLKILNKELQDINQMPKSRIAVLAGCAQNKPSHVFKYFQSITKHILRYENIQKSDQYNQLTQLN